MSKLARKLHPVFLVAAALTLLLPIDLIPDTIPLVGWLDDLAAVVVLIQELLRVIRNRRSVTVKE